MPEMDGVETTRRIRALGDEDSYFSNVPIIALTANAVSGMKEMFLSNGFDDFMSKPIDTVKLNSTLEKWIPKWKKAGFTVDNAQDEGIGGKPGSISIEGLDADRGIQLSGGTLEYYIETLATFYEDGRGRGDILIDCLDSGDLNLYITHVHALKSALANIGAESASSAAYALETAGTQGDLAYINANNDAFLARMAQLLDNIGGALSARGKHGAAAGDGPEAELFKTELKNLKLALEVLDIDEMNRTIDALLNSQQADDVQATVRSISKHILLVEYEEADALIASLLN